MKIYVFAIFFCTFSLLNLALAVDPPFGQLSVDGTKLLGADGSAAQLRGMSLFWSQWMPQFWNEATIKAIKCDWNSNAVRAPMAVEADKNGYLKDPATQDTEYKKVVEVIEAAIAQGIYVIVDWHEEHANDHQQQAIEFFTKISAAYGKYPNILYETFNEPNGPQWPQLKPYHEAVIAAIRKNDPKNIIIVGTPSWDQELDKAAAEPIKGQTNIMYTLHYYSGSHKQDLRDKTQKAIDSGLPVFITEYGITTADGAGGIDEAEAKLWWEFAEKNKLSYMNWAIDDKDEGAAALKPGTKAEQVGDPSKFSPGGKIVNTHMKTLDNGVKCGATSGATPPKESAPNTTPKTPEANGATPPKEPAPNAPPKTPETNGATPPKEPAPNAPPKTPETNGAPPPKESAPNTPPKTPETNGATPPKEPAPNAPPKTPETNGATPPKEPAPNAPPKTPETNGATPPKESAPNTPPKTSETNGSTPPKEPAPNAPQEDKPFDFSSLFSSLMSLLFG